jgi:hypothetical protein
MKEEFLHYLWKYSLYDSDNLGDADGNKITVVHPGLYNRDAGPDFFNAKILISGTLWAGNVEIHTRSSHFNSHGHQNDPAYNNVILHIVAVNDTKVYNSLGVEVLTAVLNFDPSLYDRYEALVNNPCIIACQDNITKTGALLISQWLSFLAIERLERKSDPIMKIASSTGNDWEEVFYRMLCRYFGFRVNAEPFEMLANALPFRIIRKHADNIFQIESLLFGTAGMLDEGLFREAINDSYYRDLTREFKILSSKYSIQPLHGWIWKFSRLRPVNFPTVRISQLARMLSVSGGLFSRVLETNDINSLKTLFEVPASEYWDDHFVFGRKTSNSAKKTGSLATEILVINAVIPVMFVYGKTRGRQEICDLAVSLLESTPAEDNIIITEWRSAGIAAESAFYTQALIQLRNEYCRKRRCLDCRIGNKLISSGMKLKNDDELMMEP